uniref:Thiazole synthase n=1 Tax=Liagoropsis maxima TaxID=1653392 RepID=A0A1G4NVI6_9FLOR|nr:thiG protein [Liagoropsis maxima]SCW22680.1 thiG protein [Liagoropsis maxima]
MISSNMNVTFENLSDITDDLVIGDQVFTSRLMLGTGKYRNLGVAKQSIECSQTSIITVAIRRLQSSSNFQPNNLLNMLDWKSIWLLPNTAGCTTAEDAIKIATLGHEICKKMGQEYNSFVKLEVIPDSKYLLPDPIGTLKAAEYLISKNYTVLPYIYPDPMLAKQLEELGCATVMPLGSPIGSGQGLQNLENIQIIIENASVPVVVDAGIGTASDAVKAMEIGASAVLVNSAIAQAKFPQLMAKAINLGVHAGRYAYLAERMKKLSRAMPSSPSIGFPN